MGATLLEWNSLKRLLCLFCLLLAATAAQAQEFPKLTGRVVDEANLLSVEQETVLTSQLEQLETNSSRQLVVATVPDLQGYDIADYGYQLGREWGIGQGDDATERNNGILLIIAPNERKVRIEVGYGLEGIMTDALSSVIIQQDILPRFRDGDMPAGIQAGVDAIVNQLTLPDEEARAFASQAEEQAADNSGANWIGMIFWGLVLLFFVIIPMFSGRKGRRYRSGAGPVVIWGGSHSGGGSSWSSSGGGWSGGSGGFSGGGGSFGGGGASGGW